MKNKFCMFLVVIFMFGFVVACDAKTEAKKEEVKQEVKNEDAKKEIKAEPQLQYLITRSDNGGWVVNVMIGTNRVATYVYDSKQLLEYWNRQLNPPKEEQKPKEEPKK